MEKDCVALVIDQQGYGAVTMVYEYMSEDDWRKLGDEARRYHQGPFMRVIVEYEVPPFQPDKTVRVEVKRP